MHTRLPQVVTGIVLGPGALAAVAVVPPAPELAVVIGRDTLDAGARQHDVRTARVAPRAAAGAVVGPDPRQVILEGRPATAVLTRCRDEGIRRSSRATPGSRRTCAGRVPGVSPSCASTDEDRETWPVMAGGRTWLAHRACARRRRQAPSTCRHRGTTR